MRVEYLLIFMTVCKLGLLVLQNLQSQSLHIELFNVSGWRNQDDASKSSLRTNAEDLMGSMFPSWGWPHLKYGCSFQGVYLTLFFGNLGIYSCFANSHIATLAT